MKAILSCLFLISVSVNAKSLFPSGHSMCLNALELQSLDPVCGNGTTFYVDNEGRCGCLAEGDYVPSKRCIVSYIVCEKGSSFSSIYRPRRSGMTDRIHVGCGCFSTDEGVHVWSDSDVQ